MGNALFLDFLENNWIIIVISILLTLPILPSKLVDKNSVSLAQKLGYPPPKNWSIMKLILRQIFDVFGEFAINLGLKGSVSIVLFAVVFTDLFNNKVISSQTVIVIAIAVLSLYLEYLVTNADEIEFFRLFKFKKSKQQLPKSAS